MIRPDERCSSKPILVFVANSSWYLYNFRLRLLCDASLDYTVVLVSPVDSFTPNLVEHGFNHIPWAVQRSSVNPLSELYALFDLTSIYRRIRPSIVHHFTIKACLYGTVAAKLSHVYSVLNAVTGLGHVFLGTRRRTRLLRAVLFP